MKKTANNTTNPAFSLTNTAPMKNDSAIYRTVLTVVAASIVALAAVPGHAGLYRWVDSSGKVHFSDKVPPAIAQKGHTELALNGMETKKVLSAEELRLQKEAQQQQAEVEAEKKRQLEQLKQEKLAQQKHDKFLLSTFDNKNELIQYYKDKFAMLSGTANILLARNETLEDKITSLRNRLKVAKSAEIRQSLEDKIKNVEHSMQQYEKALEENQQERNQIKAQYQKDLIRFTEISG